MLADPKHQEHFRHISEAMADQPEPLQIHCFDPWSIVKAKPNSEERAKRSLEREHFEVYFGERREFISVTIPARKISSKTRYRRRSETRIIERVRPIYPGYLFVRRLYGGFDLYRAWELDGVMGLCCFGESPATVSDFTIEMLRFDEARGAFDTKSFSVDKKDIQRAERQRSATEKGEKPREGKKPLDEFHRGVHFVEEFGRITRTITAPGLEEMRGPR